MKSLSIYLLCGFFILASVSCNNGSSDSAQAAKDSNATKMDSTTADSTARAIPATVSKADQDFAVNTAIAGMTEIQAGQLAEQKESKGCQGICRDDGQRSYRCRE
jgi:hypothetical protein